MKKTHSTLTIAAACLCAVSTSTLQAATLYWVGGDGGTWSDGAGGWSTVSGGAGADNATWNNANLDTASFDSLGSQTVNLGSDITVARLNHNFFGSPFDFDLGGNTLTFDAGGNNISYNTDDGTFSNGTIGFARNSQFKVGNTAGDAGVTVTFDADIAGAGFTLTKVNFGTLALGGSNVFGNTSANHGTLLVKAGSSLGTGDVNLGSQTIATVDYFGALTLQTNSAIADTAALDLANPGNALNLDFTGTEVVGSMTIVGNTVSDGLYSAGDLTALGFGGIFSGDGNLFVGVIPEPSAFAFLGGLLGLGAIMIRRRR